MQKYYTDEELDIEELDGRIINGTLNIYTETKEKKKKILERIEFKGKLLKRHQNIIADKFEVFFLVHHIIEILEITSHKEILENKKVFLEIESSEDYEYNLDIDTLEQKPFFDLFSASYKKPVLYYPVPLNN